MGLLTINFRHDLPHDRTEIVQVSLIGLDFRLDMRNLCLTWFKQLLFQKINDQFLD